VVGETIDQAVHRADQSARYTGRLHFVYLIRGGEQWGRADRFMVRDATDERPWGAELVYQTREGRNDQKYYHKDLRSETV
jgi:hypothetical protein